MAFLPIFASILGGAILIGITIDKLSQNKNINPLDIYPNAPIINNYTKTQFTEGGYTLLEKDLKKNKNGTYTLSCYKLDHRQGDNAPKPKLYKFVILQDCLITVSTEGERVIKEIVSKNITDYPNVIRKTEHGKEMLENGIKAHLTETFGEAYKQKDIAVREIVIENSMGEMTAHQRGKLKEDVADFYKIANAMKESGKEGEEKK